MFLLHLTKTRTSEFAPRRAQKFLSYISGWLATLSWQAGTAGAAFVIATLIQGSIAQYSPTYEPKRWQGTLFACAVSVIHGVFNIFLVKALPWLQTIMMLPHVIGWIPVIIFLACLAPKAPAHDVFLSFTTQGWEPIGLSLVVGQIASVYFLIRKLFYIR
jgi:amino acid transporter